MKISHKSSPFRIFSLITLTTTLFSISTISFSKNIKENSSEPKSEVGKKIKRKKKFIITSYQYETTSTEEAPSNSQVTNGKKYVLKSGSISSAANHSTNKTINEPSSTAPLKNPEPILTKNNSVNNQVDSTIIQDTKTEAVPQLKLIKEGDLVEKAKMETAQKSVQQTLAPQKNTKIKKAEIKAEAISKYQTRTDLIYKYSNNRTVGRAELFLPFYQTNKSLVFTDIRYWLDNNSTNEGNLGLGYRQIFDDEYILGIYEFYDRRKSQYGNSFAQFTTGAELLTVNYDFRANLYSPTGTTEKPIGSGGSSASTGYFLNGHNVVYVKETNVSSEYALKGYDIEIGRKLPFFDDFRVFIAGYKFNNHNIDINGYRYRGLYTFLKSKNSKLFLEGERSDDSTRGATSYVGFRYSYNFGEIRKNKLTDLEKRMTNQVIRDLDIVTQSKISNTTSTKKIKGSDGSDQKIIYVNNSAATNGDGTIEKPYKTLAEAQNNSSTYNIIYIYRGDGTDSGYNQGITLKDYQKVYGQNVNFTLGDITDNSSDNGMIFIKKDNYSSISNVTGPVINAASNNVIRGLEISSTGKTGINYNDKQRGITIKDNFIHHNAIGINIVTSNNNATNTIQNNIINSNSTNGISITSNNSSIASNNISDNTINSNIQAISITAKDTSNSINYISRNSLNTNTGDINTNQDPLASVDMR